MGLFKKAFGCRSTGCRVRQKPVQLDLLDYNREREFLSGEYGSVDFNGGSYVRSSKQGSSSEERSFSEDVQSRRSVDSSNECS